MSGVAPINDRTGLNWELRPMNEECLKQVEKMELESYPDDEACSPENLRYRFTHAAEFCKMAVIPSSDDGHPPRVIGFVLSTLSPSAQLHHESMSSHDAAGAHLCIHSVVSAPDLRRKGLGRAILSRYIDTVEKEQSFRLHSMHLLCKQHLIPFYTSTGFELKGVSDVVHGKEQWFECVRWIRKTQPEQETESATK